MPAAVPLKFHAFLSYSHADTAWAKWLHGRIESFALDPDIVGLATTMGQIPARLRPVFRDRDEFSAGETLAAQTLTALDASAAFILLCSPASARSRYVSEEVRLFRERHAGRPLIPVIVDGMPGHPERECFPPALLAGRGTSGLLAADLRESGDGRELAVAKVVARLIGLGTDQVFRRAQRSSVNVNGVGSRA